jgi:hypothetical protein
MLKRKGYGLMMMISQLRTLKEAWACKKYCGHHTLPPAAIEEARAHVEDS